MSHLKNVSQQKLPRVAGPAPAVKEKPLKVKKAM